MDENIWTQLKDALLEFLYDFGPNVIYAAIALVLGLFLIKFFMRLLNGFLKRSKVEATLTTFIQSLSIFVLYGLLIFVVGITLGIEASSFMAMFEQVL